jgi:putative membrane protein
MWRSAGLYRASRAAGAAAYLVIESREGAVVNRQQKVTGMVDARAAPSAGRFEVRVTADSHFAWVRTRLSLERTIMSWLRTAVALIGFGFAIVQYLEHLQRMPGTHSPYLPDAPQYLGLALISCGVLALVVSIWQYRWTVRYLWGESFAPLAGIAEEGMNSPVLAIAILLIFIGIFAFLAVLLRLV